MCASRRFRLWLPAGAGAALVLTQRKPTPPCRASGSMITSATVILLTAVTMRFPGRTSGQVERECCLLSGGDNPGGSASNYPLLGRKCLAWEGGTRVFAAASGGMIPATLRGTSNAELMHIADWYVELYVECAGSVFFILLF